MFKLNNKGMTTIEVIICFVLITLIAVSMYSTISSFNERRIIEQYKEEVTTYKNLLTKDIQDDFIKIGLTHVNYNKKVNGGKTTHTLDCDLKDGTKRQLVIIQQIGYSSYHIGGTNNDDEYMIKYGVPGPDLIEYPIPDLGSSEIDNSILDSHATGTHKVKDLSINNVLIEITDKNVLSIYIGFYHPELSTRYGIKIVSPINYYDTKSDESWTYPN